MIFYLLHQFLLSLWIEVRVRRPLAPENVGRRSTCEEDLLVSRLSVIPGRSIVFSLGHVCADPWNFYLTVVKQPRMVRLTLRLRFLIRLISKRICKLILQRNQLLFLNAHLLNVGQRIGLAIVKMALIGLHSVTIILLYLIGNNGKF